MYVPFTYLIGWSNLDRWYYGVRYKLGCNPSNLWTIYFTSSTVVDEFRKKYGEPDIIEVRHRFQDSESAKSWEEKVLRRLKVKDSERWLNRNDRYGPPQLFGHTHNRGRTQNEQTISKRRASMLATMERKFPPETRKKKLKKDDPALLEVYRQRSIDMWANRSEAQTVEIGKKISEANRGIKRRLGQINSEQHRAAIREGLKNSVKHFHKYDSPESRIKASLSRKGKKMTEEWKRAQSERIKAWWAARKAAV